MPVQISGRELVKALSKDGWETVRVSGSHHVITLAGVIFTLQGVGVIGGSGMSGDSFWAVAGPVIAVVGLAIAMVSLRRRLAS
jgi:HicA toxin of bacterial toxin-antitoxin,